MIKSTKIHILDGPFTDEWSIKPVNGGITYVEPVTGFVWDYTWEYAEVESLQFLYENISGGGMSYSPGGGFLGAEALALLVWLLAQRETRFLESYTLFAY
jgi:hypothetical protein